MKKIINSIGLIAVVILFVSCRTQYGVSGFRGGYSEIKIDESTYDVSFKGNGTTSSETIKRYFLYRCAELTLDSGYEYFVIRDKDISSSNYVSGRDGDINTVTKTSGSGIVKMYHEKPDDEVVYVAKELKQSLDRYIKRGRNLLM